MVRATYLKIEKHLTQTSSKNGMHSRNTSPVWKGWEVSGSCAILKKRLNILDYIARFEKVNLGILLKTLGAQVL